MSIEKKSLINNMKATKKALIAATSASSVASSKTAVELSKFSKQTGPAAFSKFSKQSGPAAFSKFSKQSGPAAFSKFSKQSGPAAFSKFSKHVR
jgi:hypothetical protein